MRTYLRKNWFDELELSSVFTKILPDHCYLKQDLNLKHQLRELLSIFYYTQFKITKIFKVSFPRTFKQEEIIDFAAKILI